MTVVVSTSTTTTIPGLSLKILENTGRYGVFWESRSKTGAKVRSFERYCESLRLDRVDRQERLASHFDDITHQAAGPCVHIVTRSKDSSIETILSVAPIWKADEPRAPWAEISLRQVDTAKQTGRIRTKFWGSWSLLLPMNHRAKDTLCDFMTSAVTSSGRDAILKGRPWDVLTGLLAVAHPGPILEAATAVALGLCGALEVDEQSFHGYPEKKTKSRNDDTGDPDWPHMLTSTSIGRLLPDITRLSHDMDSTRSTPSEGEFAYLRGLEEEGYLLSTMLNNKHPTVRFSLAYDPSSERSKAIVMYHVPESVQNPQDTWKRVGNDFEMGETIGMTESVKTAFDALFDASLPSAGLLASKEWKQWQKQGLGVYAHGLIDELFAGGEETEIDTEVGSS